MQVSVGATHSSTTEGYEQAGDPVVALHTPPVYTRASPSRLQESSGTAVHGLHDAEDAFDVQISPAVQVSRFSHTGDEMGVHTPV
jgi:hypothetical protein